jgi:hypothetical protein
MNVVSRRKHSHNSANCITLVVRIRLGKNKASAFTRIREETGTDKSFNGDSKPKDLLQQCNYDKGTTKTIRADVLAVADH